ncbi:hypothetical protein BBW68_03535 [Candidatus Erwinia dacicola]|uniref:ATP-dependent helicase C-terminal family protein n=1 Tax=Candidatus Erwinia dacicola TaxID=252393 RepID=A0A1E7Z5E8_9GAMM|nr:hypothetical protein BBW68_03535 [Candidatus Erwinia dacicola]RAP71223.1 ATP-dependent helicase C-terminal family protein [Candidatus Erwinia dacicola]
MLIAAGSYAHAVTAATQLVLKSQLLARLERWLLPAMSGVRDARCLRQLDCAAALLQLLTWSQRQQLDTVLPTHYTVLTGSRLPIQ